MGQYLVMGQTPVVQPILTGGPRNFAGMSLDMLPSNGESFGMRATLDLDAEEHQFGNHRKSKF
jgi:hypothetical protein